MSQRWYRSNIVKAVLIILAHILTAVMIVSVMRISAYPALCVEVLDGSPAREYKDSDDFAERMMTHSIHAAGGLSAKELFEAGGEYDPEKQVDIEAYYNSGMLEAGEDGRGKDNNRRK